VSCPPITELKKKIIKTQNCPANTPTKATQANSRQIDQWHVKILKMTSDLLQNYCWRPKFLFIKFVQSIVNYSWTWSTNSHLWALQRPHLLVWPPDSPYIQSDYFNLSKTATSPQRQQLLKRVPKFCQNHLNKDQSISNWWTVYTKSDFVL